MKCPSCRSFTTYVRVGRGVNVYRCWYCGHEALDHAAAGMGGR